MKRRYKVASTVLALFLVAVYSSVYAQQVTIRDEIELTRSVINTQRKAIVAANMDLTDTESAAFWPIYNEYKADKTKIGDRQVDLITSYADSYVTDSLTDDKAKDLIKEYFSIQKDLVDLKEKYLKRFEKVLPAKKVMRFYQIDNKLDAVVNAALARDIPLAE